MAISFWRVTIGGVQSENQHRRGGLREAACGDDQPNRENRQPVSPSKNIERKAAVLYHRYHHNIIAEADMTQLRRPSRIM